MRSLTGLAVLFFGVSSSSCGDMSKAQPLSETAVVTFHAQYDAGQFESMYDGSDAVMKAATPKPKFQTLMETVHAKLGQHVSSKRTSFSVNSKNFSTTTAVLREDTKFEHGSGTETFTYLVADGAVKLQGYRIDSDEFELK